jgi:hypothetical protein
LALVVVAVVGHGIWIFVALLWKGIFHPTSTETALPTALDDELRDITATQRQLQRLVDQGALYPTLFDQLSGDLRQRRLPRPRHFQPKDQSR